MDMTYTVHHNMHDCMEAFQLDVTPQYLLFVNPVSVPVIWGKLLIWDPKEEEWINHQNENNNARPLQPKVIKHPKTRKQNVEHADRVNLEWNCLPSSDNKFTSKIGIMSHHNKPSSLGDEHNHSHSLLEFPNYKYIIYIYTYIRNHSKANLSIYRNVQGIFSWWFQDLGFLAFPFRITEVAASSSSFWQSFLMAVAVAAAWVLSFASDGMATKKWQEKICKSHLQGSVFIKEIGVFPHN